MGNRFIFDHDLTGSIAERIRISVAVDVGRRVVAHQRVGKAVVRRLVIGVSVQLNIKERDGIKSSVSIKYLDHLTIDVKLSRYFLSI